MSEQCRLLELEQRPETEPAAPIAPGQLKLRLPERRQIVFAAIDVERLVGEEDAVRAIWALTGRLDLSGFTAGLRSARGAAGRAAWDPRLLTAIWIWAYSQAISSAREIERQSHWRPQLRWLCGMEVINHHTLSDFRVAQQGALDEIFTQVLGLLSHEGLLDLEQVTVDGTRLRAQASSSSERRRGTIEQHLEQAREAVTRLSREAEAESEASSPRRQAARQRAAREKWERLEQPARQVLADAGYNSRANIAALGESGIELATPAPAPEKGSQAAARAAGIAAGYEAKFFIWDEATKSFQCPAGKRLAYRRRSHKRGRAYRQHQAQGADCRGCEQRLRCCPNSFEQGRLLSQAAEDELMGRHREWMESERARAAYRRRSEVAEFPHAWLKERFGVRKFRVRGLRKARAELLWALLAYNVQQWVRLVWRGTLGEAELGMAAG